MKLPHRLMYMCFFANLRTAMALHQCSEVTNICQVPNLVYMVFSSKSRTRFYLQHNFDKSWDDIFRKVSLYKTRFVCVILLFRVMLCKLVRLCHLVTLLPKVHPCHLEVLPFSEAQKVKGVGIGVV